MTMGSLDPSPKASASSPSPPNPWITTPLLLSAPLSRAAGCNVYLKLDNLQPSGSFKSRGIGYMMQRAHAASARPESVHFFASSGGNAGLACAVSAAALGRPATVVVPDSTPPFMADRLRALGATVVQTGATWAAADKHLRERYIAPHGDGAVYVNPFDHPDIWAGAETLVDEVVAQIPVDMDAVVCNVGGGGLLNGVVQGLERHFPSKMPRVLAVETLGAHSLNASVRAGRHETLDGITSIATSLGATRVSNRTWEIAQKYCLPEAEAEAQPQVVSATVTDAQAVEGCVRFLDDARILVEVACGATVATAYNGDLRRHLGAGMDDAAWARFNVVVVVCGGSNINLGLLNLYREEYGV